MTKVRKSLLLSMADSYLGLVLQLASTVIISRLLTPSEVGVFAIAAVFAAMASTFRDFGVAEYLIQEKDLTSDKIRAAFALNILVSWSVALALFLASGFAADFFREPGVGLVMKIQSANFLLIPFGAVTQAWFRRELNYRPIIICNLLSSFAAFATSIVLALSGFGYMSLAWSSLAGIVVIVAATSWFRPKTFPRWPSLKAIGPVFQFGKFASMIYIFAQVGKGGPELIIGRVYGSADVGIFSRGNGLIELFSRILLRPVLFICMPYFANEWRERGSIVSAYKMSISLLTAVGWPFLAVMSVMAFVAIRVVYGEQWLAAVPLMQVLCLACALELLFLPSREALLAIGEARRAGALQFQIVVLQLLGLSAVVPFGLAGATFGLVLAAISGAALSQWHLRETRLKTRDLLRACLPSLILVASTAGPLCLAALFFPVDESNYLRWLVLGSALAISVWLVTLMTLKHALWFEMVGFARAALRRKRPPARMA